LGGELLKVGKVAQPSQHNLIVNPYVFVHEHIAEADGLADPNGECRIENSPGTKQSDRIAIVLRWSPTLSRADVLCDVDTGFYCGYEGVLDSS
jgi:hypothetical protein